MASWLGQTLKLTVYVTPCSSDPSEERSQVTFLFVSSYVASGASSQSLVSPFLVFVYVKASAEPSSEVAVSAVMPSVTLTLLYVRLFVMVLMMLSKAALRAVLSAAL